MNALLLAVAAAIGLQVTSDVDVDQVRRLGNTVQRIDVGLQGDIEHEKIAALAPPKDDADKWCLTVLLKLDEHASAHLKSDWEQGDPTLTAWGNPHANQESFSHLQLVNAADESQQFRFAGIDVPAYPCVLLSVPRSGKWGKPGTVVAQLVGYDGNPQQLSDALTGAIEQYVTTLARGRGFQQGGVEGTAPDWKYPPKAPPAIVGPGQQQVTQLVPPLRAFAPATWPAWLWAVLGVGLTVAVIYGPNVYRRHRAAVERREAERLDRLVKAVQSRSSSSA